MAKASGVAWTTLTCDDHTGASNTDIRNDCTNLQFSTPRAVTDVTGLDVSAIERILLLSDFSITLSGQFNPTGAHQVFRSVTSTAIPRSTSMVVNGSTLPNEVLYSDYSVARAAGGDLNWTAAGSLCNGIVPTWS
jgi:hypothetical protein